MSFMVELKNNLNGDCRYNVAISENGALGYKTTGRSLLDLNFSVASLRSAKDREIIEKFLMAFGEDRTMALKWLFFARDVREGLGERRLFRVILKHMAIHQPREIIHLLSYVPEYGRWDDILSAIGDDIPSDNVVFHIIGNQLRDDQKKLNMGAPISLLAKWMPSINTSSKKTVKLGRILAKTFNLTEKRYRKMLSAMRKHIDVIETKMSSKQWNEINYETVPSRANLLYGKAFLKNDEIRRRGYLAALEKGEAKINAGTLFPHDIVHRYTGGNNYFRPIIDQTLEELWKALPNRIDPESRTIVVADGSGSMTCDVGNTGITALDVANALAIYFAERLGGEFFNKYITFSSQPRLVNLSGSNTLVEKIYIARRHNEVSNTNIEAVFRLILETAVIGKMKQNELPANILIVSDMEFDNCGGGALNTRLFEFIKKKYEEYGYKIPRLIFWNVNSRTGTIPVKENDLGVALVSGFSVNIAKMVMSGKTDPYECLVETLMGPRYENIVAAD